MVPNQAHLTHQLQQPSPLLPPVPPSIPQPAGVSSATASTAPFSDRAALRADTTGDATRSLNSPQATCDDSLAAKVVGVAQPALLSAALGKIEEKDNFWTCQTCAETNRLTRRNCRTCHQSRDRPSRNNAFVTHPTSVESSARTSAQQAAVELFRRSRFPTSAAGAAATESTVALPADTAIQASAASALAIYKATSAPSKPPAVPLLEEPAILAAAATATARAAAEAAAGYCADVYAAKVRKAAQMTAQVSAAPRQHFALTRTP